MPTSTDLSVDIHFHNFFFLSFSFWFLFTRSPKETTNMTSGWWVELRGYRGPHRKKDDKCQSEVRRWFVPVQPQVILKTSKKLRLSCLHIGGFRVTSSPPCWWTVNERLLISPFCLSTSICSFHHCYLCLPRLHENHLLVFPSFRACLHGGGGPQVGEVTPLGGVKQ